MNHSYYNRSRAMMQHTMRATRMMANNCPCNNGHTPVTQDECDDMVVAMAYVPTQCFGTLYEPDAAFPRGTIFPELDKPLMVGGTACG